MDLLMPQLGETVAEGKITKWFKSVGDAVKPGDNLFEIETDKVTMEVPSTVAGTLSEVRVTAGEVAPVGAIVGIVADGAGAAATAPLQPPSKAAAGSAGSHRAGCSAVQPTKIDPFFEVRTPDRNFGAAKLPGGISTTPLARRLASEAGIDLSRLRGTGPHGRVVARDIEDAPRGRRAALAAIDGPGASGD